MKKIAIVTGSDKKYFPFLKNLVFSLKKTKSLEIADLCILDVEDKSDYLGELKEFIHEKKIAKFNLEFKFKDTENWFKLLTERPFIKDHFPGYEKYVWLDADTHVLNKEIIYYLDEATNLKDVAIVPELNESYVFKNKKFGIKKIFFSLYKISGWSFKNYKKYFNSELAENLFFKPLFNNGVFCIKSSSKIWDLWKVEYQFALNKAKTSYGIKTDQLSLNKVLYENFNLVSILDSTNNWIIDKSEPLFFDKDNKLLLTPSYPRRQINILHFTNMKFDQKFECDDNFNNRLYKKISDFDG